MGGEYISRKTVLDAARLIFTIVFIFEGLGHAGFNSYETAQALSAKLHNINADLNQLSFPRLSLLHYDLFRAESYWYGEDKVLYRGAVFLSFLYGLVLTLSGFALYFFEDSND